MCSGGTQHGHRTRRAKRVIKVTIGEIGPLEAPLVGILKQQFGQLVYMWVSDKATAIVGKDDEKTKPGITKGDVDVLHPRLEYDLDKILDKFDKATGEINANQVVIEPGSTFMIVAKNSRGIQDFVLDHVFARPKKSTSGTYLELAVGGISVGIRVSMNLWLVTNHISVGIGTTLKAGGPPMAGTVHGDFWVSGSNIDFGDKSGMSGPDSLTLGEPKVLSLKAYDAVFVCVKGPVLPDQGLEDVRWCPDLSGVGWFVIVAAAQELASFYTDRLAEPSQQLGSTAGRRNSNVWLLELPEEPMPRLILELPPIHGGNV